MLEDHIASQIRKLEDKYKHSGQDLSAYLDGLLYQRYLTYWDYIHLDTLLSLQVPKTHFPDEEIFIMYHQITELYFKLILHELKQLAESFEGATDFMVDRLRRINSYYKALISSFSIMIQGMEKEQFMRYRMALLPASGFQSVQYRTIEFYSTPLNNLVSLDKRGQLKEDLAVEDLYEEVYWKKGATDLKSGEKTLTLKQFENRYTPRLLRIANQLKGNTLYEKYLALPEADRQREDLISELRLLDANANIKWPLVHMGSAKRYLGKKEEAVEATGGTNWKSYLPPHFQKIIFFPILYSLEEQEEWGKAWVDEFLAGGPKEN